MLLEHRIVSVQEPNVSVGKILRQHRVFLRAHIPCPDHFCRIDIGIIVDPLPVHIVTRLVPNDHKLFAGEPLKLANNFRSFQVPARPSGFNLDVNCRRGYAQQ